MSATLDRIKKLLALADNEAASDNEADVARKLADRLLAAAGITEADLHTEADPAASVARESVPAPSVTWHGVLARAVSRVTGCAVWRDAVYGGGQVRQWAGTADQRASAIELHAWLIRQVNRLADNARKSPEAHTARSIRSWLHDYRCGIAQTVAALARDMVEAQSAPVRSTEALQRVDAVNAAIEALKPLGMRQGRAVTRASAAYAMGQAAGRSIALRRSVELPRNRMLGGGA